MTEKELRKEGRNQIVELLIAEGYMKKEGFIKHIPVKHGSCCACTTCGQWYDECICESNRLWKAIKKMK